MGNSPRRIHTHPLSPRTYQGHAVHVYDMHCMCTACMPRYFESNEKKLAGSLGTDEFLLTSKPLAVDFPEFGDIICTKSPSVGEVLKVYIVVGSGVPCDFYKNSLAMPADLITKPNAAFILGVQVCSCVWGWFRSGILSGHSFHTICIASDTSTLCAAGSVSWCWICS